MNFGASPTSTTTATTSPYDVMVEVAQTAGISTSVVTAIQNGMGLTPGEMTPYIVGLAAAQQANPGAEPGQLAANVLNATPTQVQTIDKGSKAQTSTAGQTGAFTDIFGDLFEVVYPFLMFAFGAVALAGFVIVTLVGIAKSPAGKGLVQGASAGAGFAALAA